MSSEPRSQATQPSSVQASQISGGFRGSTPRPETVQSNRSSTAHDGTASESPISSASPTVGAALNAGNPPRPTVLVVSVGVPRTGWVAARLNEQGTMASSSRVLKVTGSETSVRGVATRLSARTITGCGCGAASQKVAEPRAAAGGRNSTPISSRNLM